MDDRVIGVHCQNGFDVADAVGVEPAGAIGSKDMFPTCMPSWARDLGLAS
jgi:hypothetical protein